MTYIPGDHWVICDQTGFKVRRSQVVKQWDGLLVRRDQHDPRHPQELVKAKVDRVTVSDPRPRKTDVFLEVGDVTGDDL